MSSSEMLNSPTYSAHFLTSATSTLSSKLFGADLVPSLVLSTWASVKTTKGFTLVRNGTDFEKATTNFTIRYPKTPINRDMTVHFKNKVYTIEYLNDVDEAGIELEIQAKEITH